MNRTDTLCPTVRGHLEEPDAVGIVKIVDSPRALSLTDFWNDAIEAAAQAAEEVARTQIVQATGGFLISLGADQSAAAIRKLKR